MRYVSRLAVAHQRSLNLGLIGRTRVDRLFHGLIQKQNRRRRFRLVVEGGGATGAQRRGDRVGAGAEPRAGHGAEDGVSRRSPHGGEGDGVYIRMDMRGSKACLVSQREKVVCSFS